MVPAGTTTVGFHECVPGAQFAHIVKLEPSGVNDEQMLPIWQRFLCHALVSKLPEKAMTEVEERLVEIWEDYATSLTATKDVTGTFAPRLFMAQQGRRYPRPEIEVED
jgi:hypothetical protein